MNNNRIGDVFMLKTLAIGALATGILLPGGMVQAASPQQVYNPLEIKPLVQAPSFSKQYSYSFSTLRKSESYNYIYVNNAGHITFNVNQKTPSDKGIAYGFYKMEVDGTKSQWAYAEFIGTGSFTFSTKKPIPVGTYTLSISNNNKAHSKSLSGDITFTTP
jgi:hypothetical protein